MQSRNDYYITVNSKLCRSKMAILGPVGITRHTCSEDGIEDREKLTTDTPQDAAWGRYGAEFTPRVGPRPRRPVIFLRAVPEFFRKTNRISGRMFYETDSNRTLRQDGIGEGRRRRSPDLRAGFHQASIHQQGRRA